jgi:hypothetical protein
MSKLGKQLAKYGRYGYCRKHRRLLPGTIDVLIVCVTCPHFEPNPSVVEKLGARL